MSNFVTITAVSEERTDKNGRKYVNMLLEQKVVVECMDPETGEVFMASGRPVQTIRNAYERSYLNDNPDYLWGKETGTRVPGSIVKRKVHPYEIGQRVVDHYTTFVEASPSDENFEEEVARAFKDAGHPIGKDILIESIETEAEEVKADEPTETSNEPEASEEDVQTGAYAIASDDEDEDLEDEF